MDQPLKHSTVTSLTFISSLSFLALIALAIVLIGA